jgi:type I restriction enzyme S subunit
MNEGGDLDKLGRGALWQGEFSPCVHQNHVFVVRCGPRLFPAYLNCWTGAVAARRYFMIAGKQTTNLASINKTAIGQLPVAVPPLEEQEAIAGALSDADALIESVEQLIAKNRWLKQGVMQELLTGNRRLPGFSEEWEVTRLGELGCFLKGSGVTRDESASGNLACVRYGEIYTRHSDYIKSYHSWISHDVATSATRLKRGDILFAGSGETKEEIGKSVAVVNDVEAYAGGDIVILRSEGVDPLFLGYYLNTAPINRQKASRGQGDAVVHISAAALADIRGALPSVEEQTAIATILSDTDAEIAALEAKLAKVRSVKQGMMQELLTGRIRLV